VASASVFFGNTDMTEAYLPDHSHLSPHDPGPKDNTRKMTVTLYLCQCSVSLMLSMVAKTAAIRALALYLLEWPGCANDQA
jgi:hypothetical protein